MNDAAPLHQVVVQFATEEVTISTWSLKAKIFLQFVFRGWKSSRNMRWSIWSMQSHSRVSACCPLVLKPLSLRRNRVPFPGPVLL